MPDSAGVERRVDEIQSVSVTFDPPLDAAIFHAKPTAGMIVYRLSENRRYVAGADTARDVPLDVFLVRRRDQSNVPR